jgi:hypothetical protein
VRFEITWVRLLLLSMHKCPAVGTGGSCGHGHVEVGRVHVGRYSMAGEGMCQGEEKKGVSNFVGLQKDLTTEYTERTEKVPKKISVNSVFSVVEHLLAHPLGTPEKN